MTGKNTTEEILKMISRYGISAKQINSGDCDIFAKSIERIIPRIHTIQNASSGRDHDVSREVKLPTEKDHVWIWDPQTRLHYDAETPYGVKKPMELEFFKRLTKNPQSPGFEFIGTGQFASAYALEKTVEIIVREQRVFLSLAKEAVKFGGKRNGIGDFFVYDMSKEAMIVARDLAPENLKKFFPKIERSRLDIDKNGKIEFVYKMPFYKNFTIKAALPNKNQLNDIEETMSNSIRKIYFGSRYNAKLKYDNSGGYPMAFFDGNIKSETFFSHPDGNLSISEDGTAIFRDPIVCLFFPQDAIRLFASKFNT